MGAHGATTKRHFSINYSAVIGFACLQAYLVYQFYMGQNRALSLGAFSLERGEIFCIVAGMGISLFLCSRLTLNVRNILLSNSFMWCYVALLTTGSLVAWVQGSEAFVALVLEGCIIGAPLGLLIALWGRILGSEPIERSVAEVLLGSVLGVLVCFVMAVFVTPIFPLSEIIYAFFPIGSACALQYLLTKASECSYESKEPQRSPDYETSNESSPRLLNTRISAGVVLFGVSCGMMQTYGSEPGMLATPSLSVTLLLFAIFCLAALQLFEGHETPQSPVSSLSQVILRSLSSVQSSNSGPLDGAYRLSMLLLLGGFVSAPLLTEVGIPAESVLLSGFLAISAVLASLFLVMGKITQCDPVYTFGRGFAALYLGQMLGVVLGNICDFFSDASGAALLVIAGLSAVIAFLFLFTEGDFRALSVAASSVESFDMACSHIVQAAKLSVREAQVLPLALRGRTGERIAAELFVSKSTVETHLRHIYQKCGVRNRQELIDYAEAIVSEGGHDENLKN